MISSDEATGLDYRLFWRMLRSRNRKTKTFCDTLNVDDTCYESPEDVSSGFCKFYENILNAPPSFTSDEDELFYHDIESQTRALNNANASSCPVLEQPITVSEVHSAIKKNLKRNKAPGHDMIQNEHIIRLYMVARNSISMTELFNCILRTEVVPNSWKHSIIVPLYKGKGLKIKQIRIVIDQYHLPRVFLRFAKKSFWIESYNSYSMRK